jgi:uncharacterized protein (DUF1800 family)
MTHRSFFKSKAAFRIKRALTVGVLLPIAALALIGCGSGGVVTSQLLASPPSPPTVNTVPIVVQAAQFSVPINGTDLLTAAQGTSVATGGQWVVSGGSADGLIDATGTYHAPGAVPNPASVVVNYVLAGSTYSTTLSITDANSGANTAPIVVQAAQASVATNGTDLFTVTQQASTVTGGQWVVIGGVADGVIDPTGIYRAPSVVPISGNVVIGYVLTGRTYTTNLSITTSAPTISSIVPSVIHSLTSTLQIVGTGFDSTSFATVNGTTAPTTFVDAQHLAVVVTLPAPNSNSLQIAVADSDTNAGSSNSVTLNASFPVISVQPAALVGGPINLVITGSQFSNGDVVLLNGKPLTTTINSATQISANGYLTPWSTGGAVIEVASGDGTSPLAILTVPIVSTAVSYDAAARFTTQAAFGPRPDIVQHIQKIGFDAYVTEQFQQPPVPYLMSVSSSQQIIDFVDAATQGTSLLRMRVALGFQSIFVTNTNDFSPAFSNLEIKLEADVTGNFRQLLDDIAGDPGLTLFLNLPGNQAATNQTDQPNQNFARELMQLFTLGPVMLNDDGSAQVDGNGITVPTYDQDTVIALTRALTGWNFAAPVNSADTAYGIDYSQPLVGIDSSHDHNAKTLFGTILLPAGQSVTQDRQSALDAIFNHPNLPPFICHLLIQRLVKSDPSPAYIQRMAAVFEDDGTRVRGNLGAVIRAILEDPEARLGDTTPSASDGFLQEPILLQLFAMNALQATQAGHVDIYLGKTLGESMGGSPTVFYYFSPSYVVPGTSIISPEFMQFNNASVIQRSQALWGITAGTVVGFSTDYQANSWLFTQFTNIPDLVDALNHLIDHGTMSPVTQAAITDYCSQLNPYDIPTLYESAIFLAINSDFYNVAH